MNTNKRWVAWCVSLTAVAAWFYVGAYFVEGYVVAFDAAFTLLFSFFTLSLVVYDAIKRRWQYSIRAVFACVTLAVVIAVFLSRPYYGQIASAELEVNVLVYDAVSDQPVANATVSADGNPPVVTDRDGVAAFSISQKLVAYHGFFSVRERMAPINLSISADGYESEQMHVGGIKRFRITSRISYDLLKRQERVSIKLQPVE